MRLVTARLRRIWPGLHLILTNHMHNDPCSIIEGFNYGISQEHPNRKFAGSKSVESWTQSFPATMFHGSDCRKRGPQHSYCGVTETHNLSLSRVTVALARTVRTFTLLNLGNNGSGLTNAELHRGQAHR